MPVVVPTPITILIVLPPGIRTPTTGEIPTPDADVTVGAVANALNCAIVLTPIAALARLAEAPLIVVVPFALTTVYWRVDAVASLAVTQVDANPNTMMSFVTVKIISAFVITLAVADLASKFDETIG